MNAVVLPTVLPPQDIRVLQARALVGWLSPQDAQNRVAIGMPNRVATQAKLAAIQIAQESVAQRDGYEESIDIIRPAPESLNAYIEGTLKRAPGIVAELNSGWDIKL